jgi:hypothetical protein
MPPGLGDGGKGVRLACPECGEGEAFVMEGREDRAAVQSPQEPRSPAGSVGGFTARCGTGRRLRGGSTSRAGGRAFSVLGDLWEWP